MVRARGRVLQRSSALRQNSSLLQNTPSCAYTFASLSLYFQAEEIGFTLLYIPIGSKQIFLIGNSWQREADFFMKFNCQGIFRMEE